MLRSAHTYHVTARDTWGALTQPERAIAKRLKTLNFLEKFRNGKGLTLNPFPLLNSSDEFRVQHASPAVPTAFLSRSTATRPVGVIDLTISRL